VVTWIGVEQRNWMITMRDVLGRGSYIIKNMTPDQLEEGERANGQ